MQSNENFALAAAAAGLAYLAYKFVSSSENDSNPSFNTEGLEFNEEIEVVETSSECRRVVNELKRHCIDYKVLGFDCEWVTSYGGRRPVALLQLASPKGLCALFRLCCLREIPRSLKQLLEDDTIIKVGVDPKGDAENLLHDYDVNVASTFDLRFLAVMANRKPQSLEKMAMDILNEKLDKPLSVRISNWEARDLTEEQYHYAANDALAGIKIFKQLAGMLKIRPQQIGVTLEDALNIKYK